MIINGQNNKRQEKYTDNERLCIFIKNGKKWQDKYNKYIDNVENLFIYDITYFIEIRWINKQSAYTAYK